MIVRNQLTQQEAQRLFDYRDGLLFWLHAGSGRRSDLRAVTDNGKQTEINIGGRRYQAQYIVWNWHHGITRHQIVFRNGNRKDITIDNLKEIEKIISVQSPSMVCPCCAQPVPVPGAYVVAHNCELTPMETRILEAVWDGGGRAVQTERIFNRMYEDDPDGGPTPARMYATFKEKLSMLRGKLVGSGVGVETLGKGRGYRILLGVNDDQAD